MNNQNEIKVKVDGNPTQVLHYIEQLRQKGIRLWKIDVNEHRTTFYMRKKDIRILRKVKRQHLRVYFVTRTTSDRLLTKLTLHKMPVLLSLVSVFFYLYLNHIIFFVQVDVADPFDKVQIKNVLAAMDIKPLQPRKKIPENETIRLTLKEGFPTYKYFDINKKGGILSISGEGNKSSMNHSSKIYSFTSPRKGLITSLIVYQGRKCVETNQVVEKGQELITGELNEKLTESDSDDNQEKLSTRVPIVAEVTLNTWIKVTGSYRLDTLYQTLRQQVTFYQLRINDYTIPLSLKHQKSKRSDAKTFKELIDIGPLYLSVESVTEAAPLNQRSHQQDEEVIYQLARKQLSERLLLEPNVTDIHDEKILHQSIENDKVNMTVFYSVFETYDVK